ncbi:MAG: hypothetical protein K5668_11575 [Lachnospiraceae bacterium]|nr:hypothetical protein [Lachnospiraceae bacterium]
MNKYDEYFNFRLACADDTDSIMRFIGDEWKKDHILSKSRELFLWQHGNSEYGDEETINIYLMTDKKGSIVGINGFVQYSNDPLKRYISSCITKVKADLPVPMCGVELVKRFKRDVPANAYYSSGTSEKMIPIGKKIFNYTVGLMQQYYILNPTVKSFKIAGINGDLPDLPFENGSVKLEKADFSDVLSKYDFNKKFYDQAYKSPEFIEKRYFRHPVYTYNAYGVVTGNGTYGGVILGREIEAEGSKVFRIVDYLGDTGLLGEIGGELRELAENQQYEYVDITAGTLPGDIMKRSGFRLLRQGDDNIIPMHFEPFEKKNVFVRFQKSSSDIIVFKADGDQDRPNFM